MVFHCAHSFFDVRCARHAGRVRQAKRCLDSTLHPQPHLARRLVWSPLRASSDHRFIVGALRAQRPYQLPRHPLLRPRVARAQKIVRLHPLLVRVLRARRAPVGFLPIPCPYSILSFRGSLVDPRLRASNEHFLNVRVPRAGGRSGCPSESLPLFRGVANVALYCAHSLLVFYFLSLGRVVRVTPTAAVERAHSDRARSGSKGVALTALPSPPSE